MKKHEAFRLIAGDVVTYADNDRYPDDQAGEVVRVSSSGQILIKVIGYWSTNAPLPEYALPGASEVWLPCKRVWQVFKKLRPKKSKVTAKPSSSKAKEIRRSDPSNPYGI